MTRTTGVGDDALDGLAAVVMFVRLALLLVLLVAAAVGGNDTTVPPGFAICLLLGTAVSVYGLFVFYFPLHRFGLVAVAALALAVISGVGGAQHRIREMSYAQPKPRAGDSRPVALADSGLVNDEAALKSWLATLRPARAAGGGGRGRRGSAGRHLGHGRAHAARAGLRAGVPLAGAGGDRRLRRDAGRGLLRGLAKDDAPGGDAMHLDAKGDLITTEALRQDVSRDSLTPLTKRMVLHVLFPGFAQRPPDRGDAIQEAWLASTRGVFGQTVRSLREGETAGWRPSLILSPMIVEDGRRLLISNLDLDAVATQATRVQGPLGRGALEFARLFTDAAALKLGTAARMSATFPYVMPAVELPTAPPLRMVDAGYYNKHGVSLAAAWLLRQSERSARVGPVILMRCPTRWPRSRMGALQPPPLAAGHRVLGPHHSRGGDPHRA